MTDERDIAFVLDTHDPEHLTITFQAPENNTIVNLGPELRKRHVWLMPPVPWNNAFISLCGIVDDFKDGIEI